MKKYIVLLFSVCLLGFSAYGLMTNSYYARVLLDTSAPIMYARVILIGVLLGYLYFPGWRFYTTRFLVSASGILLVALGVTSVYSPTLLGLSDMYIAIGDTLTLIEGGILAIVLSAELPAQRRQLTLKSIRYKLPQFTNPLSNIAHTGTTIPGRNMLLAPQLQQNNSIIDTSLAKA